MKYIPYAVIKKLQRLRGLHLNNQAGVNVKLINGFRYKGFHMDMERY